MKPLVVIPARGGSKGIPHKNIKLLGGKPLICYAIDAARKFTSDENICVSTDDEAIIRVVEDYGLKVPFKRPDHLATDNAGTNGVLLHALDFYEQKGHHYDVVVLLQATSPFRRAKDVIEAVKLYDDSIDMVVSVMKSHAPAVLCNDNQEGFVELVYNKKAQGRQSLSTLYEFNGAIYVINVGALKEKGLAGFDKRIKYVMPKESSIDINDIYDFMLIENIMSKNRLNTSRGVKLNYIIYSLLRTDYVVVSTSVQPFNRNAA